MYCVLRARRQGHGTRITPWQERRDGMRMIHKFDETFTSIVDIKFDFRCGIWSTIRPREPTPATKSRCLVQHQNTQAGNLMPARNAKESTRNANQSSLCGRFHTVRRGSEIAHSNLKLPEGTY